MYLQSSLHVHLVPLRPSLLYMHKLELTEGFLGGLCHHRLSGCAQEGLESPICSSSLQQLLTMGVVGISFFSTRKPGFQFSKARLSLFAVYWLIKCTKMLMRTGAKIWPPARSEAIWNAVLLCKTLLFKVCLHGIVIGSDWCHRRPF